MGAGTGLSHQLAGDFSGPLDSNDRLRYRLNFLDDEGDGYVKGSKVRRQLFSLGTRCESDRSNGAETNFSYYHFYDKGLPGKFALGKGLSFPSAPNPKTAHLGQSYAGDDNHTLTAGLHLKHDFDGNWQGEIGVLRQIADRESTAVTNTFTDSHGDYTATTSSATASRFTINSYMANLNGEVDTGWIHHQISTGAVLSGRITTPATVLPRPWAALRWIIPRLSLNRTTLILPTAIIPPLPASMLHFCSAIICSFPAMEPVTGGQ
ncbi:hypothetical protein LZ023_39270 (plasmid) [Pseudomonas silvicola]|nr:hypothetical protein LZ023_39270 [Pseudomonas silvicola]